MCVFFLLLGLSFILILYDVKVWLITNLRFHVTNIINFIRIIKNCNSQIAMLCMHSVGESTFIALSEDSWWLVVQSPEASQKVIGWLLRGNLTSTDPRILPILASGSHYSDANTLMLRVEELYITLNCSLLNSIRYWEKLIYHLAI